MKFQKNIYSVKSTDHFIWLFSQFPKAFDFYLDGGEYQN